MVHKFHVQGKLYSHTISKYKLALTSAQTMTNIEVLRHRNRSCCSLVLAPIRSQCVTCDAGTSCTKCCTCQPCTRGRPKKASTVQETPHGLNPERRATCTSRFAAEPASELDTMNEGTSNYASSQVHICQVLKLMGCDEHENSVRTLPSIEIRRQLEWASDREIDHASMRK